MKIKICNQDLLPFNEFLKKGFSKMTKIAKLASIYFEEKLYIGHLKFCDVYLIENRDFILIEKGQEPIYMKRIEREGFVEL